MESRASKPGSHKSLVTTETLGSSPRSRGSRVGGQESRYGEPASRCSRALRFPWGFPPLKSAGSVHLQVFPLQYISMFYVPRNISSENSLLALCSLACLVFYLALLALCFSSEKLQVFLFNLQLNVQEEAKCDSAGGSPVLQDGESISNCCCDYCE